MQTLVNDPLGVQMLMGAGTLQVIGSLIIRKLVNIGPENRTCLENSRSR